jgi:hypothetical protein
VQRTIPLSYCTKCERDGREVASGSSLAAQALKTQVDGVFRRRGRYIRAHQVQRVKKQVLQLILMVATITATRGATV